MKTALLLTFLLASSVVMATPHRQGTIGRLTRDAENGPGTAAAFEGFAAEGDQGFSGMEASSGEGRK